MDLVSAIEWEAGPRPTACGTPTSARPTRPSAPSANRSSSSHARHPTDPHLSRAPSHVPRRARRRIRDGRGRHARRAGGRRRGPGARRGPCSSCSARAAGSSRFSISISEGAASCGRRWARRHRSPTRCSPCRGSAPPRSCWPDRRRRRTAGSGRSPQGKVMTAFAMTEPEAGSDVAAHRHHRPARRIGLCARRHQDPDLQRRHRRPLRRVRLHRPGQGAKGISCFLVPADAPGLRFAGPQVLSAPHPLGEIAFEDCRRPGGRAARQRGTRLRRSASRRSTGCGPRWPPPPAGWRPARSPSRWPT